MGQPPSIGKRAMLLIQAEFPAHLLLEAEGTAAINGALATLGKIGGAEVVYMEIDGQPMQKVREAPLPSGQELS